MQQVLASSPEGHAYDPGRIGKRVAILDASLRALVRLDKLRTAKLTIKRRPPAPDVEDGSLDTGIDYYGDFVAAFNLKEELGIYAASEMLGIGDFWRSRQAAKKGDQATLEVFLPADELKTLIAKLKAQGMLVRVVTDSPE